MSRCRHLPFLAAVTLVAGACELGTGPNQDTTLLDSGFASVLLGYNNVQSSFAAGTDGEATAWMPAGGGGRGGRGGGGAHGGGAHGGGGGMCGGGLGGHFL